MKKTQLILVSTLSALLLIGCAGNNTPDDGRTRTLAPQGETIETKSGVSKLKRAVKATPLQNVWSLSLSRDSSLQVSGNTKNEYTSDSSKNVEVSYDVSVTEPVFDLKASGLNGASIANAKAEVEMGGDISVKYTKNGDAEKKFSGTDVSLKAYLDGDKAYLDPRGTKTFVNNAVSAIGGDQGKILNAYINRYFKNGYYFETGLTDEDMPLIQSDLTDSISDYLDLFYDHAEDYANFLNVKQNGDSYSFYLTLNKEDLIRIATDLEAKVKDDNQTSVSFSDIDFNDALKGTTVNAYEVLVTFNENALLSASFNIDTVSDETTDLTETDSDGNSTKTGTSHSVVNVTSKGTANFANDAPTIPAEVSKFADGKETFGELADTIETIIKSFFPDGSIDLPF